MKISELVREMPPRAEVKLNSLGAWYALWKEYFAIFISQ
jgi:hypothetical protein